MTFTHKATISKVDNEKRIVFGWAYQMADPMGRQIVDKSGEFIDDVEELEEAAYKFVVNSRVGGYRHRRENGIAVHKSDLVESIVFTPEKCRELGIPAGIMPQGWWVGFRINDDSVWQEVKKGHLTSFSIHGNAVAKRVHG